MRNAVPCNCCGCQALDESFSLDQPGGPSGWTVYGGGDWSASGGKIRTTSGNSLLILDADFDPFIIARLMVDNVAGNTVRLIVGFEDQDNFYSIDWEYHAADRYALSLWRMEGGTETQLGAAPFDLDYPQFAVNGDAKAQTMLVGCYQKDREFGVNQGGGHIDLDPVISNVLSCWWRDDEDDTESVGLKAPMSELLDTLPGRKVGIGTRAITGEQSFDWLRVEHNGTGREPNSLLATCPLCDWGCCGAIVPRRLIVDVEDHLWMPSGFGTWDCDWLEGDYSVVLENFASNICVWNNNSSTVHNQVRIQNHQISFSRGGAPGTPLENSSYGFSGLRPRVCTDLPWPDGFGDDGLTLSYSSGGCMPESGQPPAVATVRLP